MDRGAWWAVVRGVAKESDTIEATEHTCMFICEEGPIESDLAYLKNNWIELVEIKNTINKIKDSDDLGEQEIRDLEKISALEDRAEEMTSTERPGSDERQLEKKPQQN